ncbi:MAG: hypothetical protein ACO3AW_07680, partial [Chitinophagaceae bacterium]
MRKKILQFVFSTLCAILLFTTHSNAQIEAKVSFTNGFIGRQGTNPQKALTVQTFSTLGISKAYFIQNTASGRFELQGNDLFGTVRLVYTNNTTKDISGGIVWRETTGSTVRLIGFIPSSSITSFSISKPAGGTYTVDNGSNVGLKINGSTLTFSDGNNIDGNAATVRTLLDDLNTYLDQLAINGGTIGTNSTICSGSTKALTSSVLATGGDGTAITYQWQSSTDNITFSDISGATSSTYTTPALTQTTYYRRKASDQTSSAYSNTITITVTSINVSISPSSVIVAPSDPVSLTASGATTYSWSPSTGLSATTGSTVTSTVASTTTYTVTGTSAGCTGTKSVTVTVSNGVIPGVISDDQTICSGSTPTVFSSVRPASGGTGTRTYQWQKSTTSSSSGFSDISGANSATYTSGALTTNTWFRRAVTDQATPPITEYSNVVLVTVDPVSVGGTASATATTICTGSTASLSLTGNTGTIQWQYSTDNTTWSNVTDGSGATTAAYTSGTLTQTTYFKASVQSGICLASNSNTVTITVSEASVGGTASAAPSAICSGS